MAMKPAFTSLSESSLKKPGLPWQGLFWGTPYEKGIFFLSLGQSGKGLAKDSLSMEGNHGFLRIGWVRHDIISKYPGNIQKSQGFWDGLESYGTAMLMPYACNLKQSNLIK